ncbi:MAG: methyltransferase domain-containing protein [Deltaproteobacteria bacterium]|nr:methyltransferase domain-containing protein [Candidatus Zymogenaceae bacterium]
MNDQDTPKHKETNDDLYAGIASRYDILFEEEDHTARMSFYEEVLKKYQANRVLDCSCGTGKYLTMLAPLGLSLFGSDVSPSMLAVAQENIKRLGLQIPLTRADFRSLPEHFSEPFDAILCLSTSLPHVGSEDEMIRALSSMYASLTDRGVLIITHGTSERMMMEQPRFLPVVNNRDLSRVFVIDYHGRGITFHVLDFIHTDSTTEFLTWSATYPFMPLEKDYRRMLEAAGFKDVEAYGGYDFSPYTETSEFLIVVAGRNRHEES